MKQPLVHIRLYILVGISLLSVNGLKAQKVSLLQQGKPTSIRGLSVVDNNVAWISGSKGYVAITRDAGKTWSWQQVKGYEQADFRDIEAFSDKEAIIMSSGTPALILKTTDGGATWDLKYKNEDKAYFLDAMDFANKKHGFILGDPINNKFLLLETTDGGNTWHPFKNMPDAMPGEAAFAASGTCLRVNNDGIIIVTGGKVSHEIGYYPSENKWVYTWLPVKQGKDSQGTFSVSQDGDVFVGGDYSKDKITDSTACLFDLTIAGVKNGIRISQKFPAGYQSCVEYLYGKKYRFPDDAKSFLSGFYISTGTSGTNISDDGGFTWQQIDQISYNVCRKAKKGSLVLLAGDRGKIGIFTP